VSWLRRRKFLALLAALLSLIVVYPMVRRGLAAQVFYQALLMAVFAAALLTAFEGRGRLVAALLGGPALLGVWIGYALPELPRAPTMLSFHAAAAAFLAYTIGAILADVYRRERIDADGVNGALCGYLLLGLVFAHLYCLLETASPGSFRASDEILRELRDEGRVHFQLTYFSFVTLTTVGYGDITPATDGPRGLAVVEAMVGQFYVAVLLGELIGKRVSQALEERPKGP
jgi:hypothetical protein